MMSRWRRQRLIYHGWTGVVGGSIVIWFSLREGLSSIGITFGVIAILLGLLFLGAWYRIWKRNKDECSRDWMEL